MASLLVMGRSAMPEAGDRKRLGIPRAAATARSARAPAAAGDLDSADLGENDCAVQARFPALAALLLAGTGAVSLAADLKPLPLSQRMLRAGDLAGFTPDNPVYVSDPSKAAQKCPDHEADRLRKSGFVAAAGLHLGSGRVGRDAISYVTRFRSAASATADVSHFVASHPACTTARKLDFFKVTAIPGAHGIAATRSDGVGYDIVFSDGVFSYDVGAFTTDPRGPPTRMDVVRAATRLYVRVHGHPARA
jgi:hypothetical protein